MSQHVLRIGGREYRAEVRELTPERATVIVDGKEYAVDLVQLGRRKMTAAAAPPHPAHPAPSVHPTAPAPAPGTAPASPPAVPRHGTGAGKGEGSITAPMPGLVVALKAKEGDIVQAGQALLVMEAMKMENAITAPYSGTVSKIYVREGDSISEGDALVDVARPKMTSL